MSQQTLVIRARIEEVPTIAQFTVDSYTRDITDFQTYKPAKYTPGFLSNIQTQITAVNAIINPKQLTAELKLITGRIITNTFAIRPLINKLEGYLADATGLSIAPKDFGLSEVRKAISNDDQERLSSALAFVLQNITNNIGPLTAADYTAEQRTQLTALKTSLDNDNAAQNAKMSARAILVTQNYSIINALAQTVKDIWADGKRLYKISEKTKVKDYTNAKLIARIRQEELRTTVTGTITATEGTLTGVKLQARPVTGGRSKTVRPDSNNVYILKGLKPIPYNIRVTATGKEPQLLQVTPITNQTVTLDIRL